MGIRSRPITLRSVAAGSVTTSFAALGDPLAQPVVTLFLKNSTDGVIQISEDGTNAHHQLAASEAKAIDIRANRARDEFPARDKGTQFYVKYIGSAPTTGFVVIEGDHVS